MNRVLAAAMPPTLLYGATWAAFSQFELSTHTLLGLTIAIPLVWLTLTDLHRYEIPDTATALVAAIALLDLGLTQPETLVLRVLLAIALTAFFLAFGSLYFRRTGVEGLGIGDAKLFGAAALLLGLEKLPELILLSSLGGIVGYGLARIGNSRQTVPGVPFGPFIAYAAYLMLFLDPVFI